MKQHYEDSGSESEDDASGSGSGSDNDGSDDSDSPNKSGPANDSVSESDDSDKEDGNESDSKAKDDSDGDESDAASKDGNDSDKDSKAKDDSDESDAGSKDGNDSDASKDGSDSDSDKSGGNSGSESGSGSSSNSSNSDNSDSDKSGSDDDEENNEQNVSNSSAQSRSSTGSKKDKKEKYWEEDPEMFGIRRSVRDRKQTERMEVDPSSPRAKRRRRTYNSSDESMSEPSDSEDDSPKRRPPKKVRKKRKSENSDSDGASRRISRTANSVSYKEADSGDDKDLLEEDELLESEAPDAQVKEEDENVQTIEKIIDHRVGKRGAVGMQTYIYEVEKNGDPNTDFDSNDPNQTEMQYLVKWKGWAHIHNTWESEESIKTQKVKGLKKLDNYMRKEEELALIYNRASPEELEYLSIQSELEKEIYKSNLKAERIFAEAEENGNLYYFVKWENLPYSEATWELQDLIKESFMDKVDSFELREQSTCTPRQCSLQKHRPKFTSLKVQPDYLGGENTQLELRDYQMEGVNWLVHAWCKYNSVILADEMGLGKTIQTISFLSYLFHTHHLYGPFILVLPLSTLNAWLREFEKWAPDMNVIVYIGDRDSRKTVRDYEWTFPGTKRLKFNCVLTTYEILLRDKDELRDSGHWSAVVVDEAHRLKNEESQLYQALMEFKSYHRLLITGTPLQNSLKELWALLHFIMPDKFPDWESFESQHDDENLKLKGCHRLHKQLEPYLLRRVKKDVEKSLPAKVEQILRVDMTQNQKQFYKWILTKNYDMLKKGNRGSTTSFVNIVMELKKCCNHSYLTKPPDYDNISNSEILQQLLKGSGKLMLLDKLLVRLNETGHRVLIFSQMVRMLDILAQYLQFRRFPFQRLDGSIKGDIRRQALDHFNAEGSNDFCFLLSTRAGGLGINLATADTVIIFDSDWNPQNDLQAQARAHRIGQKNQVNIYRLVTKNSIEENIIERAKKKMVLDHLVIQSMDTSGRTVFNKKMGGGNATPFNKEELNAILKFGAEELFKDDEENEEEPMCDIDEILMRAETRDEGPASAGDDLLSAFKVASFNLEEEEEVSQDQTKDENSKDWDDIIPQQMLSQVKEEEKAKEMAEMYLPPRKRKTLNNQSSHSPIKKRKTDSDEASEGEESDEDKPKKRGRPPLNPKAQVKGFNDTEVRRFFRSFKKFSNPLRRLDTIAADADLRDKKKEDLRRLGETIIERCKEVMKEHEMAKGSETNGQPKQRKDRGPSFKISGVSINAKTTLATLEELMPLDEVVPHAPVERASWVLGVKKVKDAHYDCPWTIADDSRLLRGIYDFGMGSWPLIKNDPSFNLENKILLDNDLKPQGKHLESRAQYLFKLIKKEKPSFTPKAKQYKPRGPKKTKAKENTKELSKEIIDHDESSNDEHPVSSTPVSSKKNHKAHKEPKVEKETKAAVKEEKETTEKVKEEPEDEKASVKKREKKDNKGPLHITANGEPIPIDEINEFTKDHPLWQECKEKMRPMKKALQALDNPNESETQEQQIQQTRKCLLQIGDHIEKCLEEFKDADTMREYKTLLWQFVSKFTEYNARKLHKLYRKSKKDQEEKNVDTKVKEEDNKDEVKKEHKDKHHHHHHHKKDKKNKDKDRDKHKDKKEKEKEKDRDKDKKDDRHGQKRRNDEDSTNSSNKKIYNGREGSKWSERDGRDRNDQSKERDQSRDRDKDRRSGGDRYNRGPQQSGGRDWHGGRDRYSQDYKKRDSGGGGYQRDSYNKPHGYQRGSREGGEWGGRHYQKHGSYNNPPSGYNQPRYPPPPRAAPPPPMYGAPPPPGPRMGGHGPPQSQYGHRPEWRTKDRPHDWNKDRERPPPQQSNYP